MKKKYTYNLVLLDTSIYKALGFNFRNNVDYKNIISFVNYTTGQFCISNIVEEEFFSHYKRALDLKTKNYIKSSNTLARDLYFKKDLTDTLSFKEHKNVALHSFRTNLNLEPKNEIKIHKLQGDYISSIELTKFILNERENGINKPQVRDFMIMENILSNALLNPKTLYTFITGDKIFTEHDYFKGRVNDYGAKNIEIFPSIDLFLAERGYYIKNNNNENLFNILTPELIKKDLLDNYPKDLLSHIHYGYNSSNSLNDILDLKIKTIEVESFYTFKELNGNEYKFIAHIEVQLYIKFSKDDYEFNTTPFDKNNGIPLHTFSNDGNPIYDSFITFIYEGNIVKDTNQVSNPSFIDWIPEPIKSIYGKKY